MNKNASNMLLFAVFSFLLFPFALIFSSCAHPMAEGKDYTMTTISKTFASDANKAYEGVRWALKTGGYAITNENLTDGIITSGWLPSGVDSFYLDTFGEYHRNYGVNSSYYKLVVKILPDSGANRTKIEITSHVKSMMAHLKSSGKVEHKVMKKIADYLRGSDITLTNIGIEE